MRKRYKIATAVFILFVLTFVGNLLREIVSISAIISFILGFDSYAFLAFSLIFLFSLFVPYATTVMSIVAGILFGSFYGFLIVMVYSVLGSLLPFYVGRYLGREWIMRKVKENNLVEYVKVINENVFMLVFYIRLVPSIPYELQNYLFGLSNISVKQYLLATFLGLGPIIFIHVYLGESLLDVGGTQFWIAVSIFVLTLIAPLIYYYGRRISLKYINE